MTASLDRIFSEIADFSRTMGSLHGDFLKIVSRDINRFLEETNNLKTQMQWQGWTTVALTTLGASMAIAGALIPSGTTNNAASSATDTRLGANGIGDSFSNAMKAISEKLADNDFLRTTCKTSAKFFNGVIPAADTWFRHKTTGIEAKRSLLERVNLQDGQSKKSIFDQQVNQAQQAAQRLIETKSKGG